MDASAMSKAIADLEQENERVRAAVTKHYD
jgi:hypothetical protein